MNIIHFGTSSFTHADAKAAQTTSSSQPQFQEPEITQIKDAFKRTAACNCGQQQYRTNC